MKRLFASVFCALLLQGSALATTLQTKIGDISIPTAKEINEQIDSLASDASLSDDDKKTLGTLYKTGLDTLDQISALTAQQKDLDKYLKDANRKLLRLATDYTNQQKIQDLTSDDIKNEKLGRLLNMSIDNIMSEFGSALINNDLAAGFDMNLASESRTITNLIQKLIKSGNLKENC